MTSTERPRLTHKSLRNEEYHAFLPSADAWTYRQWAHKVPQQATIKLIIIIIIIIIMKFIQKYT